MTETMPAEGQADEAGGDLAVPSGQELTLLDVISNVPGPEGLATRFRFLAPGIAPEGGVDFDTASADIQWLCTHYALPKVAGSVPPPGQIIITLMDRNVPFGQSDPDATQFFEAFSLKDGACIWEVF